MPGLGSRCSTCGKVCHNTRGQAKQAKKKYPHKHLSVYRCGDYFHVGNLPKSVIAGEISRDEIVHRILSPDDVAARRRAASTRPLDALFIERHNHSG